MTENQRDSAGRFLPGVNGKTTGVSAEGRRTRLLKLAKDLAEKYPMKDLECAEGNPLAVLLYMAQRGDVPGIPEDQIEAIDQLPGYEAKLAARAAILSSVSERIMCINALLSYTMPKLFATEIKGTLDTFTSRAEVGRDLRAHAPHVAPPDAEVLRGGPVAQAQTCAARGPGTPPTRARASFSPWPSNALV